MHCLEMPGFSPQRPVQGRTEMPVIAGQAIEVKNGNPVYLCSGSGNYLQLFRTVSGGGKNAYLGVILRLYFR